MRGPTTMVSGYGANAEGGGSTPARSAAIRSKPACVQIIRVRASAPLRLAKV